MTNANEQQPAAARKSQADRRVKTAFFVVILGAMVAVYFGFQRGRGFLPGWPGDIDKALAQAKAENHNVLALFLSLPPDQDTTRLAANTLAKEPNPQNIAKGNFIKVKVVVGVALTDPAARRFNIRRLPTLLILAPDGREMNRREGLVGQLPFSQGFLDMTEIVPPPPRRDEKP